MNKELIYNGTTSYGKIGEDFGDYILRVGDIVSFVYNKRVASGVIVAPPDLTYPIVMGFGSIDFDVLFKEGVNVVVRHDNVTTEMVQFLSGTHLAVEEIKPVRLTLNDIENELGYKIEIID